MIRSSDRPTLPLPDTRSARTPPIHVLRVTPHIYYPPPSTDGWPLRFDPVGGMQTQIYDQSRVLDDLGVQQTVLTAGMPGTEKVRVDGEQLRILRAALPMLPFRSRLRGTQGLNQSWALGAFLTALRLRRSGLRVHLVHTHASGVLWPLAVGPLIANLFKVPHVLTIHCSAAFTYHAMSRTDALQVPLARAIERWAIARSQRIVTLTDRLADEYIRQGGNAGRFRTIPDCVDVDQFAAGATAESAARFRTLFRIPPGRHVVTYVGRVAIEKGWRRFVALADRLPAEKYHFLVVGDGNEGDRLRELIQRRGWGDRFTVTGFVDRPLIPGAYACSDVLFLPSKHEELGSTLLEAMASGCPVVASAVGGIPEVVRHGHSGMLVDAGNLEEVVAAVERLATDRPLRERIRRQAQAEVRNRFEMARTVPLLLDLYKELVPPDAG